MGNMQGKSLGLGCRRLEPTTNYSCRELMRKIFSLFSHYFSPYAGGRVEKCGCLLILWMDCVLIH